MAEKSQSTKIRMTRKHNTVWCVPCRSRDICQGAFFCFRPHANIKYLMAEMSYLEVRNDNEGYVNGRRDVVAGI